MDNVYLHSVFTPKKYS